MYGKNPVTKPFHDAEGNLLVNSIFYTLQGEGPDAGCPAVFVRLAKCNLRCFFCDTEFDTGKPMTVGDILVEVKKLTERNGCRLVVLTGGEPLLQNVTPLVMTLNTYDYRVSIETAGTVYAAGLAQVFWPNSINKIICSPKTPGLNAELVKLVSAWKYIVRANDADADGLPQGSTQAKGECTTIYRPRATHKAPIYVQPMDEGNPNKNALNAEWAATLAMKHGYRLSLQMHKIVGVP